MSDIGSVKSKLREINETGSEVQLYPVLKTLFLKLGFKEVEITHGATEFGKDLVFNEETRISTKSWYSAVVKNGNASQKDFEFGGDILRQIKTSFSTPYLNSKGENIPINKVLVIVNGTVSDQARRILESQLESHLISNVEIWNYQKLAEEINSHIEEEFLGKDNFTLNLFKSNQIERLSSLKGKRDFYKSLNVEEIDDIFVGAKTTFNRLQEEKKNYNYDSSNKPSKNVLEDDTEEIIKSNKNILVKGIAASGKSLLLKRVGINALKKDAANLVFYFELPEIEELNKDKKIQQLVEEQYSRLTNGGKINYKNYSKIICLFDGLDELSIGTYKIEVFSRIVDFLKETESLDNSIKAQILIASRNFDLIEESEGFSLFEEISLLPFDLGQALNLAKKLIPNNKKKAEAFVNALGYNQLSNSLARTPMALTLMAILYRDDEVDLDELPANITELYNKFTDYYLNRWDANKGISQQYKYEETKNILGLIANHMHFLGVNYISLEEFIELANALKKDYAYEDLQNPEELLKNVEERSGVLIYDNKTDKLKFIHQSFQEYFTSISIDDSSEDKLLENFFNEWWSNVLIFYSGKHPKRFLLISKILKDVIPNELHQKQMYVVLLSRILQASHLIRRSEQRRAIKNIINALDDFYKSLVVDAKNTALNPLNILNTIDFIVRFRDFVFDIFDTKHIDLDDLATESLDVITNHDRYSDLTRYSLSYLLSRRTNDGDYLEHFSADEELNVRWSRIVYIDLKKLNASDGIDPKIYKRIKKRQRKNKKYIQKQINTLASKNLLE